MRTFRRESLFYLLALLLGLAVRFIGLGALPLNDLETKWALQALELARGAHPILGSQTAYVLFTSVAFFLYGGASNFLARLVPALVGSGLILVPALFKQQLKPRPALILAFALALEPGLTALSRQAGTSILTITFLLAAWGFWEKRSVAWAGVMAGLTLLSGPALWVGLLGLALAWAIARPFQGRANVAAARTREENDSREPRERSEWLNALWYALGTLVILGTLFFLAPGGISAWLAGLPEYLLGWRRVSDTSAGLLSFALIAYQPLGLVLALVATVRGWIRNSLRVQRLSLWMTVSLLLVLFYPSRQITDLAWTLIPLWALASLEIARSLDVRPVERREVLGATVLGFLILAFIWLNFVGVIDLPGPSGEGVLRSWLLFGSVFLWIISLLLVAVGWSIRIARFGAIWGLVAALGLYSFAALIGAAGLRRMPDSVEMWRPGGTLPEADLLLTTAQQMSDWSKTEINSQPVTIVGVDSAALEWLLQGRTVSLQQSLPPIENDPLIITPNQDDPTLDQRYRGQGFVWRRQPMWDQTGLGDWLHWLAFHQAPQESETIILWARTDLFLDSTAPRP
jgi:hypothetical protein